VRPPECTCSEERNGGDPNDHTASCVWADYVLAQEESEREMEPAEHWVAWERLAAVIAARHERCAVRPAFDDEP
jgi:hypothetical protein